MESERRILMKEHHNRKAWDIGCISLLFFLCFFLPFKNNSSNSFLLRILLFASLSLFVGVIALSWPRRLKEHKERQRLLNLPLIKEKGRLSVSAPKKVGNAQIAVSAGYSHNISTGSIYEHCTYKDVGVYDGQWCFFCPEGKAPIIINTVPRSFWGDEETISFCNAEVNLAYVTDTDGKHYYISSSAA